MFHCKACSKSYAPQVGKFNACKLCYQKRGTGNGTGSEKRSLEVSQTRNQEREKTTTWNFFMMIIPYNHIFDF